MDTLDIAIEDPRWDTTNLTPLAIRAILATLTQLKLNETICEISLLACDDARIQTLNTDYRDKPKPTNVLSWPSEERGAPAPGEEPRPATPAPDGMIELGDIAISFDTCLSEATAANKPFADHVTHLIIHATLHLLGYDHETDLDAALMEQLEVKILGKLGLDDPYRVE